MYQQQQYQQNNNVCDLDSISMHDISDFDPAHYGTFTYGDYLQELQELEQGRTPMKIDRQPQLPRDLTNLHWLHHNDQQPNQGRQQPISLMVDPNTNLPVQFTTATGGRLHISGQQNITFMTMPTQHHLVQQQQTAQHPQQHFQQQQQRHDIQHLQQKYASHDGKNKDATAVVVGANGAKIFPKPVFSYSCLIAMALKNSEHGSLPVSEIYKYMQSRFPYFKTAPDGWKNSVRHNLSLNKAFCKLERPDGTSQRKGCLWSLKPEKKDQLRREIRKWKKKHPEAIKASMANPDDLSISSDSCDDDSLEEPHSISSSSKVPSPSDIHQRVPEMCMERPPSTPLLHDQQVKSEHLVGDEVEDAAKELFGADLLFSQDDIHNTEDFWNDLITSSEQHIKYNEVEKFDSHMQKFDTYDDIIEVESSVKLETATPSSNFFSSALHQPTLTGF